MPEARNSMEQLRDAGYVREVIDGLGGVSGLVSGMREYHEIVARMRSERAALAEKHPGRWVAMGKDGILAIGDSMDEVLREVEGCGVRGADIVVEFLDTNPPLLIL